MRRSLRSNPYAPAGSVRCPSPGFAAKFTLQGRYRVISLTGDVDVASGHAAHGACVDGADRDVIVDLAGVTFMDSCGYRALSSARVSLRQHGLTMILSNLDGQPARLVGLIATVDTRVGTGERSVPTSGFGPARASVL